MLTSSNILLRLMNSLKPKDNKLTLWKHQQNQEIFIYEHMRGGAHGAMLPSKAERGTRLRCICEEEKPPWRHAYTPTSRADNTPGTHLKHTQTSYFKTSMQLSPITDHPGSDYGYSHYLQRSEWSPLWCPLWRRGGERSGTPISEQFPTAISIKPLNTSSLSN